MLREKVTHEPAWEVELRLSPTSAPARMMKILEAEGGTKIAALLLPTLELVVTVLGDHRRGDAAELPDENP
jgi:hypothetical protein